MPSECALTVQSASLSCCCISSSTSSVPGPMSSFGLTRSQSTGGASQVQTLLYAHYCTSNLVVGC